MDSDGRLRHITEEELFTMEGLAHPVSSVRDLPDWKYQQFLAVDKAGVRKDRKAYAKKNGVDWQEYQIYRKLF